MPIVTSGRIVLLSDRGCKGNRHRWKWIPWLMTFKRNLAFSVLLGLAGGLFAYFLAWGLFTTHPELGMEPARGRAIAMWVAPVVFVGSLIYFAVRNRDR
jgi:hypothetical protein